MHPGEPKQDQRSFQDDALAAAAFLVVLAVSPFVLGLEKQPSPLLQAATDESAWMRRHERQASACRGQQYVAQCCTDARTDLTCINANMERK